MHTFTTTKLVNLYLQSLCKVNCVRMSDKVLQKVVIYVPKRLQRKIYRHFAPPDSHYYHMSY